MITQKEFEKIAVIMLDSYNLKGFDIDEDIALVSLIEELQSEYNNLNKETTLKNRNEFCKILNSRPEDFKEHLFRIPNKGNLICGIRHFGGNIEQPFLNISTDFKVSKTEIIEIYKQHLSEKFKVFQPIEIRYYVPYLTETLESCNQYMIQKASVVKNNEHFEIDAKLKLSSFNDDSYYEKYISEYELFHKKNPSLVTKVAYNSKDLMEECRREGLLKSIDYNGEPIGLIAALNSDFLGTKGVYFVEIQIHDKWKRKGLAKSAQRLFVKDLVDDNTIVWGTIDTSNVPSMKTALANLRVPVRYETFIPIV